MLLHWNVFVCFIYTTDNCHIHKHLMCIVFFDIWIRQTVSNCVAVWKCFDVCIEFRWQRETRTAFLALEIGSFVEYNCGTSAVTAFVFLDDFIFILLNSPSNWYLKKISCGSDFRNWSHLTFIQWTLWPFVSTVFAENRELANGFKFRKSKCFSGTSVYRRFFRANPMTVSHRLGTKTSVHFFAVSTAAWIDHSASACGQTRGIYYLWFECLMSCSQHAIISSKVVSFRISFCLYTSHVCTLIFLWHM